MVQQNDKMKLKSRWMTWEVVMDLLKLENQLPWPVLQLIYNFFSLSSETHLTLSSLTTSFLCHCLPQLSLSNRIRYNHSPCPDLHHLLALEHNLLGTQNDSVSIDVDVKSSHRRYEPPREKSALPSINDLLYSGIAIKKKTIQDHGDGAVITKMEYNAKRAKLEIPTLTVDKSTTVLLRNLVAYEQCNIEVEPVVTSYVTFVDALVNSPEDVEALRIRGVVQHFMRNNKEVSELLNSLTSGVDYKLSGGNYLGPVRSKIQGHYSSKWPQRKVLWRRLMKVSRIWSPLLLSTSLLFRPFSLFFLIFFLVISDFDGELLVHEVEAMAVQNALE